MTAPNVGKVTVEAILDGNDIHEQFRSKLTQEIQREVLPQLMAMRDELGKFNKEIASVKAKPLEEIAREANIASRELEKVEAATRAADTAHSAYRKQKLATADAIRRHAEAYRQMREEIRKSGEAEAETIAKVERLREKADIAVEDRRIKYERWVARVEDIDKARVDAVTKHTDEIEKQRRRDLDTLDDYIENVHKATRDLIDDAMRRTREILDEEEKHTREVEKENRKREKEQRRAEREAERAAKREARINRMRQHAVSQGFTSPLRTFGEVARALSGFAPRLSTPAFSIISLGALTAVGAVGSLSKAIYALPAAVAVGGAAINSLVLSFIGLSDTIGALAEGDMEKFAEAINKIGSANAQQFAMSIKTLFPLLQEVQQKTQDAFWLNAVEMSRSLAAQYLPIYEQLSVGVAEAMNRAGQGLTDYLITPQVAEQIQEITDNILGFFDNLAPGFEHLTAALLDIIEVGASFLPGWGDGLTDVLESFREFIRDARNSGELREWLQESFTMLREVWDGLWAIGEAILSLGPVADKIFPHIVSALEGLAHLLDAMPGLIFAIPAALLGWSSAKGVLNLLKNLFLVAFVMREALPKSFAKMTGLFTKLPVVGGLFAQMASTAKTAAGAVDEVGAAAMRSGGRMGTFLDRLRGFGTGLLKFGGWMAAGWVVEEMVTTNLSSSRAMSEYRDAVAEADTAQRKLNMALLETKGAFDALDPGKVTDRVRAMKGEMEAQAKSPASWLDMFRDAEGSLWGGFKKQLFDFGGTDASNNLKFFLDQQSEEWGQAVEVLRVKFGDELEGLGDLVVGPQREFDLLAASLANLGPEGEKAAEALRKTREEILGNAEAMGRARPALEALGTDLPKEFGKVERAVGALPRNVPITLEQIGGEEVLDILTRLNQHVEVDPNTKEILVKAPLAPEVIELLKAVNAEVVIDNEKLIVVNIDDASYQNTMTKLGKLRDLLMGIQNPAVVTPSVPGNPLANAFGPGGTVAAPLPTIAGVPIPGVNLPPGYHPSGQPQGVFPPLPKEEEKASGIPDPKEAPEKKDLPAHDSNVPPPPPEGSASDVRKAIEESLDLDAFKVNPWEGLPAPNILPNGSLAVTPTTPGAAIGSAPSSERDAQGLLPATASLKQLLEQSFPGLEIGGVRSDWHPDHPTGRALDIMIPGGTVRGGANPQGEMFGDQLWNWLMSTGVVDPRGSLWKTDTGGDHWNHIHARIKDGMESALFSGMGPFAANTPGMSPHADPQKVLEAAQAVEAAARDVTRARIDLEVTSQMVAKGHETELDLMDAEWKLQEAKEKLQREQFDYIDALNGSISRQEKLAQKFDASKLPFGHPGKVLAGAILGAGGSDEDVQALVGPAYGFPYPTREMQEYMAYMGQGGPGLGIPTSMSPGGSPYGPPTASGPYGATPYGMYPAEQPVSPLGTAFGALMSPMAAPIASAVKDGVVNGIQATDFKTRAADPAALNQLIGERNPLALATAAGFDVPDYTTQGGGPGAKDVMKNDGPVYDATGRSFSDTAALLDRTLTSQFTALEAKFDQLEAVLNEVKNMLAEQAVGPIIEAAVKAALEGSAEAIGTAMGQAAGPIIAQAVAAAMPPSSANTSAASLPGTVVDAATSAMTAAVGRAHGGPITGGIIGKDSVPIMAQHGEYVLDPEDVRLMGGFSGVDAFRRRLKAGGMPGFAHGGAIRGYATGGGVIGNDTVGADFFGLSQVPILGAIINLLVRVLLKVLGIEIEVRDTLDEMGKDFRQFRGEAWQAFTATGRLVNDTSALLDRTTSSEQAATDERVRILKTVIEGLIKFIIEKIAAPIGKAVANAAVSAGAGAAGGAISNSFPGGSIVGGIVSNAISAVGSAAVEIIGDILTQFGLALTSVLVDGIAELLQSLFPGLMRFIFGGDLLAALLDPIGNLLGAIIGPLAALLSGAVGFIGDLLGGLFGGLGSMLPSFDDGGVGFGVGFLPKATVEPERVLSPKQTKDFERLVDWITTGKGAGESSKSVVVHAPITVVGTQDVGQTVQDRLLKLID